MTYQDSNRLPVDRKLLTRLFSKIQISTEHFYEGVPCWEWTACLTNKGYGMVSYNNKNRGAHCLLYDLFVEIVKPPLTCDHLCRNTRCVNPIHIEPVTQKENVHRGMAPTAINARKTHCIRGHEFTPENTMSAGGENGEWRRCRTCFLVARKETEKRGYDKLMSLPYDHPRRIAKRATNRKSGKKFHLKHKLELQT